MEYDIHVGIFGTKFYYKKGTNIIHREDGPAVERLKGEEKYHFINEKNLKYKDILPDEWWLNVIRFSPEKEAILNKWYANKG